MHSYCLSCVVAGKCEISFRTESRIRTLANTHFLRISMCLAQQTLLASHLRFFDIATEKLIIAANNIDETC